LKATLKVNLDKFVKIANKAKAAGIKADPDLVGVDQLRDYSQKYYNHLIDTYKPDDAADALAIGLTAIYQMEHKRLFKEEI